MLKSVANLKDSVAGILSGLDLNNVDNLDGALERAARLLIQKADIPEASGLQNITLYNGVYDYLCNSDIFGTAINDIRPQGISRTPLDYAYKLFGDDFDRTKGFLSNGTSATFQYANGVPIIRIKSAIPQQQVILDQMNDTLGWVASGTASNLTTDSAVYYQSPASLRFLLTTGAGNLTKTITSTDLASYEDVGVAFLAIQIPSTATNLTSITLELGSDSGDYDSVTATEGFLGSWVANEWLLVAFDFASSSSTGTPNWSAIDYVKIILNATGTFTNFRVGQLFICQPSPAQILYQSAAIFVPVGSTTAQTTITSNTDTITLNDPAYTIYEFESALSVLQQTGGSATDSMTAVIENKLNGLRARNGMVVRSGLYDLYRGDNPSQELRTLGSYYDVGDNGYGGRSGF